MALELSDGREKNGKLGYGQGMPQRRFGRKELHGLFKHSPDESLRNMGTSMSHLRAYPVCGVPHFLTGGF